MALSSEIISHAAREPGRVQRWLRIRNGEGRPVLWLGMLALIFGIFSATYLVGGTATLLVTIETETLQWLLPLLYLAAGLGVFAARWWFSELVQRLAPRRLAFVTLGLAFSLVLLLSGALAWSKDESRVLSWIVSVWFVSVALMLVVIDLLFWALVKGSVDIARMQRLSRAITGLTVSAAMLSFFLVTVSMIVLVIVTHNDPFWQGIPSAMLLLGMGGAALLVAPFPLRALTARRLQEPPNPVFRDGLVPSTPAAPPLRDGYVLLLAGLALTLVLTYYLIDFAFLTSLNAERSGGNLLIFALLLGLLLFMVKLAELLFRGLLANWLSRWFGPGYGLPALPLALIAGGAFAFWAALEGSGLQGDWPAIAVLLKGLEVLLRAPALEPSLSVALQPLPRSMEVAARTLIAKRVRPLALVIASAFLLVLAFRSAGPVGMRPHLWLWTLTSVLVAMLGLSLLARIGYRRRVVAALSLKSHEAMAAAQSEPPLQPGAETNVALALKALPLYLAEFPGEYRGASTQKRRQAFERLLDLPDHTVLRPIRAAAARRSVSELGRLAAASLLVEAQAASIGPNAPSPFGSPVVLSGEDVGYGPASLALLRDFGLVLPEPTSLEEARLASAAPQQAEALQSVPAQLHDCNNPYPGLRPFEPEEARLFFGRGVHTSELLRKLSRTRFLAVVGTSGSGKSSLVRAGLIPALREGAFGQTASHWRIAILRPGGDPIGGLALALVEPDVLGESAGTTALDKDLEATLAEVTLRRSALGLADTVRQARLASGEHVLVVVDQFEELFRFKRETTGRRGSEDAAAFVKLLLEASRAQDVPVYVVLTMRSDYLGDCAEFQDLPETINDAQYLIPRLTREQRRETIVAPARVAGGAITPRLVQRLLNDAGDNPDQLPIMQHALMRTWDRWAATGAREAPLDTPHYEAIGRMEFALSQHADEIYYALSSDRLRAITEGMFEALTDKTEDGRGVRRATRLDQLAAAAAAQPEEVAAVIEAFRQPGCSFLMPPVGTPLRADTVVDISHESLMRIWARLRDWVDEETESAQTYRRLAQTAALHVEHRASLWGDPDLTQALDWRERKQPNEAWARRYHADFTAAMAFLDASDQVARQTQRRRRTLALGGLGISGAVAVVMFLLWVRAKDNLKQVQAFVDANRLDQLTRACPLLFAPETLSPEGLNNALVKPCGKALEDVRALTLRRHDHEKTLAALRRRNREKTLKNILRKEERRDEFEFQYKTVLRLVVELRTLANARFLEPGADEDKALTQLVEQLRSAYDPAKWQEAITAIVKNPRYKEPTLKKPQVGLVPLGEDPDSRLYEFAHVGSGAVPARGPDGQLVITADTGIILILIPGGTFWMGSDAGRNDERPPHLVTVPPFFLAKYELTMSQLARLPGKLYFKGDGLEPAGNRSFYDARQVAVALGLRLPTEAEWEYAVRAGTTSKYWWGDKDRTTTDFRPSAPVGSFPPNPFGLHDLAGEREEWVEDCYHSTYTGAPTDGSAWVSGDCEERVVRGGRVRRFTNDSKGAASRDGSAPLVWYIYGFRLARTLP